MLRLIRAIGIIIGGAIITIALLSTCTYYTGRNLPDRSLDYSHKPFQYKHPEQQPNGGKTW